MTEQGNKEAEVKEESHGRWFIYHMIRLQAELSMIDRRMDEISERQKTIIWGLCIVGFGLLINLFR
jgi:hypothetical protein